MSDSQEQPTEYPRPYENDLQKWVAESKMAEVCLVLWEIGAASTIVAGLLRTDLLLIAGGVVWLLVSLFIHFWRDELAPEMRTSEKSNSEL